MDKELRPVSDLMDEIDNGYKLTWYKSAFWFLVREIPLFPKHTKWNIQKLFRGYSDCDLWGLDSHLAEIIVKRLKAFRKMERHSMPCDFFKNASDEDFEKGLKDWEKTLDEMTLSAWKWEKELSK